MGLKHGGDTCKTADRQFYIVITILMAKLLKKVMKSGECDCATIPRVIILPGYYIDFTQAKSSLLF